ncbi:MAG TPA: hypothetical protein EYQ60_10445 [Myxococcales bacterium]|nr:hypothetical protein [Myxococcales bacterium]HIK86613.1 hypothetical protein [Myxococcales bacterium]
MGPGESALTEADRIREAHKREGGKGGAAARRLGMSRATFGRKRQKRDR